MNRVGDGESGQILRVRVFRALDTEVGRGGGQDVLWSWDGGRVKERSVLEHAAGGGRVDRGERLVRVGQAVGRADLHRSCACSSHRDESSALLVLLDVERVWRPDGSHLELDFRKTELGKELTSRISEGVSSGWIVKTDSVVCSRAIRASSLSRF